jgi:hypothetical protein
LLAGYEGSSQEFIQILEKSIKTFIGDAPEFDGLTSLAFKTI